MFGSSFRTLAVILFQISVTSHCTFWNSSHILYTYINPFPSQSTQKINLDTDVKYEVGELDRPRSKGWTERATQHQGQQAGHQAGKMHRGCKESHQGWRDGQTKVKRVDRESHTASKCVCVCVGGGGLGGGALHQGCEELHYIKAVRSCTKVGETLFCSSLFCQPITSNRFICSLCECHMHVCVFGGGGERHTHANHVCTCAHEFMYVCMACVCVCVSVCAHVYKVTKLAVSIKKFLHTGHARLICLVSPLILNPLCFFFSSCQQTVHLTSF